MGTGANISIGYGCVVLLGVAAVVGVLGVGAWWAKGKIDEASGGLAKMTAVTEEIERFEKQANANAYTPPTDGGTPSGAGTLRGPRGIHGTASLRWRPCSSTGRATT